MSLEKRLNGNIGAVLKLTNSIASILALVVLGVLWLGGRTETPVEKEKRIEVMMAPINQQVEQNAKDISGLTDLLKSHARLVGHPVMVERVRQISEED